MPRLLGVTFLAAGALHFLRPRMYEAIMPRYLPAHRELVYASGVAEIAGGPGGRGARGRGGGGVRPPEARPRGGLVPDPHAARRLPGQRRDGGPRGALPH